MVGAGARAVRRGEEAGGAGGGGGGMSLGGEMGATSTHFGACRVELVCALLKIVMTGEKELLEENWANAGTMSTGRKAV